MKPTPDERATRLDELDALKERHRNEAIAKVAATLGAPTELRCRDWPHTLCTKWSLPNGAEVHTRGNPDGPYVDAFSGRDDRARWECLSPRQIQALTLAGESIADWLSS